MTKRDSNPKRVIEALEIKLSKYERAEKRYCNHIITLGEEKHTLTQKYKHHVVILLAICVLEAIFICVGSYGS